MGSARSSRTPDRTSSAWLFAALLGAAAFLIEAGAGEILLARDRACQEQFDRFTIAPAGAEACMAPEARAAVTALARGPVGVLADVPLALAWIAAAGVYGLMAATCRALAGRWWFPSFVALQATALAVLTALAFLRSFIV